MRCVVSRTAFWMLGLRGSYMLSTSPLVYAFVL